MTRRAKGDLVSCHGSERRQYSFDRNSSLQIDAGEGAVHTITIIHATSVHFTGKANSAIRIISTLTGLAIVLKCFDVFISYSHSDGAWVREWLVPKIEVVGIKVCIDFRDFDVGVPSIKNIENAIQRSSHTIVVLTPAWVAGAWTEFESILLSTLNPSNIGSALLPIMKTDCELPLRLKIYTYADFRDKNEDRALIQLLNSINAKGSARTTIRKTATPFLKRPASSTKRALFKAFVKLLSLQCPWGEWSDRRTTIEATMAERSARGAAGPKPNLARTLFALEAIEKLDYPEMWIHKRKAFEWINSGIRHGWYEEWTAAQTFDSEVGLPSLYLRRDTRHTAQSLIANYKWNGHRDPLALLTKNCAGASLESGFWPETPRETNPRLLATVYSVEALGQSIEQ